MGVRIEGFPEAVTAIRLEGPKAKRLFDLLLHRLDLLLAMDCLQGINKIDAGERSLMREGLWRSAVVHTMKCYAGHDSRFSLHENHVLKGDSDGKEVFAYFQRLRNNHLIHDTNAYSQAIPCAILNKETADHRIAKIACLGVSCVTLDQVGFSNLDLLIKRSIEWVEQQIDSLCEHLTSDLESLSYDELSKRASATFSIPTIDEIDKKRPI